MTNGLPYLVPICLTTSKSEQTFTNYIREYCHYQKIKTYLEEMNFAKLSFDGKMILKQRPGRPSMNPVSINERVDLIKYNDEEINRLVEEYKPFIAACVEKATGRYMRYGEDDELSIAMIAFVEAIKSHDSSKGSFLSFASAVIRRRLIDYYRKEKRHTNVVSLNEYYNDEEDDERDLSMEQSVDNFMQKEVSEYRKLELEQLKNELGKWDISFSQLVKDSPKHEKTRKLSRDIAVFMMDRPLLLQLMKDKKYLPVAEIEKGMKIPRKKVERLRKYLIAIMIIMTGDYQYIRDFVNWG